MPKDMQNRFKGPKPRASLAARDGVEGGVKDFAYGEEPTKYQKAGSEDGVEAEDMEQAAGGDVIGNDALSDMEEGSSPAGGLKRTAAETEDSGRLLNEM